MSFYRRFLCFIVTVLRGIHTQSTPDDLRLGWKTYHPCEGTDKIVYRSEAPESKNMEFSFFMDIEENIEKDSIVNITFAVPLASIKSDYPHVFYFSRQEKINVHLLSAHNKLSMRLKTYNRHIPEINSVLIDNAEYCKAYPTSPTIKKILPLSELGNRFDSETNLPPKPVTLSRFEDLSCGVRKVKHTQLIVNGLNTKSGEWPWHVAICTILEDRSLQYICGGTLISENTILTVRTCVTEEDQIVSAKTLKAILGQYSFTGAGDPIQDKSISKIIVHPGFKNEGSDNDIAILKLDSPAQLNDYVQPACLWKPEHLKYFSSYSDIQGTVVGWGFTQLNKVSNELQKAEIPRVSNIKCVKSEPVYFSKALNGKNFCAGWPNGGAPCNGDSGGGFHVNVPESVSPGALKRWHVHGIISQSIAKKGTNICDPEKYAVFTEVEKFIDWIYKNL